MGSAANRDGAPRVPCRPASEALELVASCWICPWGPGGQWLPSTYGPFAALSLVTALRPLACPRPLFPSEEPLLSPILFTPYPSHVSPVPQRLSRGHPPAFSQTPGLSNSLGCVAHARRSVRRETTGERRPFSHVCSSLWELPAASGVPAGGRGLA